MNLIEDNGLDAVQSRVLEQPAHEDSGGDEFHQRCRSRRRFSPDGVTHTGSLRCAGPALRIRGSLRIQGSQPTGSRARRYPPGLGHDDPRSRFTTPGYQVCNQGRHQCGLAGARRCLHYCHAGVVRTCQGRCQRVQGSAENQALAYGVQVESHHTILPGIPATCFHAG